MAAGWLILRPAKIAEVDHLAVLQSTACAAGLAKQLPVDPTICPRSLLPFASPSESPAEQGQRGDLAILPNHRQSLLDLVNGRLRLTTDQATWHRGQRSETPRPPVQDRCCQRLWRRCRPRVGSATALWFTTVKAWQVRWVPLQTEILPQRIGRGRLRKAREIAEDGAIRTSQGAQVFGAIHPQRTACSATSPVRVGITRYEPLQAQGLARWRTCRRGAYPG